VHSRYLEGVGLLLMASAVAFLIALALYHRIIADGEDTGQIHHLISRMATLALLPFALSLGLDLFIGMERIFGPRAGIAGGAGFGALALFWWYGWELMRRDSVGLREREMASRQRDSVQQTPLHSKIEQMLTEARVILPGAQALLGFQLAIIVTKGFEQLPSASKTVHAVSLGLIALSVILLMAPAAYHRIVYAGEDASEFHKIGGILITAATVPLALGLSADVFVAIAKIATSATVGAVAAGVVLAGFVALWYVYPLLRRPAIGGVSIPPVASARPGER
jgi:hypothetical protein